MEKLPVEILSKILLYLSCKDRKNARLTNLAWYEASLAPEFQKSQKFVVAGGSLRQFMNVFSKSNYMLLNIEFLQTDMFESFQTFLQLVGRKIRTLSFTNCSILFNILEIIIKYCSHLVSLTINDTVIKYDAAELFYLITDNGKFIKNNLTKLSLVNCSWMSDAVLKVLIHVYPCIRELILNVNIVTEYAVIRRYYLNGETNDNESDKILTYNCVRDSIRNVASSIKCLHLLKCSIGGFSVQQLEELGAIPNLKLKEINFSCQQTPPTAFCKFISNQPLLEKVCIADSYGFNIHCVEFLLKNCTRLQHLGLDRTAREYERNRLLTAVANSRLKSFELLAVAGNYVENRQINSQINNNLESLCFQSWYAEEDFIILLINTFKNLTHLNLSNCHNGVTNRTLRILLENENLQKKLTTLKLNNCGLVTDDGFKNITFESTILNELHMEHIQLSNGTISSFVLPNLRCLNIIGNHAFKIVKEDTLEIQQQFPSLELFSAQFSLTANEAAIQIRLSPKKLTSA